MKYRKQVLFFVAQNEKFHMESGLHRLICAGLIQRLSFYWQFICGSLFAKLGPFCEGDNCDFTFL